MDRPSGPQAVLNSRVPHVHHSAVGGNRVQTSAEKDGCMLFQEVDASRDLFAPSNKK